MNAQAAPQPDTWSGIFPGVPPEQYHRRSIEVASASGLKQMLRSPAHFKHWIDCPDDDKASEALTFGRMLHMAILEPDVFLRTHAVVETGAPRYPTAAQWNAKKSNPDSDAAKAWWKEWEANNAGRTRVSTADYQRAQRMADSVREHPVAAGLLIGGEREITFRWHDEESGIRCQSRADLYLAGEYLMDVKSCRDASKEGFARAVTSYLYDVQQAHYLDGIRSNGDAIRYFVFLAIESEAPFVCQPHVLDARAEERGFNLRRKALNRQAECLRANRWPGYSEALIETSLPAYAYFAEESA